MRRALLVAASLLAATALAWWARGREPEGPRGDVEEAPAEERTPPETRGADAPPGLAGSGKGAVATPAPPGDDRIPLGDDLPPRFGVIARVLEPDQTPVPGVAVRLRLDGPEPMDVPIVEATSDAAGEARLGPLAPPDVPRRMAGVAQFVVELAHGMTEEERESDPLYFLAVVPPGPTTIGPEELAGRPGPYKLVSVDEGASTAEVRWLRVTLTTAEGIPVSGRVVTSEGVGIPGVAIDREGDTTRLTGPAGTFLLRVAEAGPAEFRVSLFTWGAATPETRVRVEVPPEGIGDLTWVLEGAEEIRGRAVEADGRPAAGAEIWLTSAGRTVTQSFFDRFTSSRTPTPPRVLSTRADAEGAFRFVGTASGSSYDVRWWFLPEEERVGAGAVPSGARDVAVRLDRHGVLPRLVDALDGRPVYGGIQARGAPEAGGITALFGNSRPEDGVLAPAGTRVTLLARARGYADAVVEHVVGERPGLDPVTIRMSPSVGNGWVRLRCVHERGAALPWPHTSWLHVGSGLRVTPGGTEADGWFTTRDLGPGSYRIRTRAEGAWGPPGAPVGLPGSGPLRFVPESTLEVVVPDRGEVEIPWTLPVGGALRLAFRGADGAMREPGDLRSVRARGPTGSEVPVRLFRETGSGWSEMTGAAVPYESQALPAGAYEVVWQDRGEGGAPRASARVFVTAGGLTPVDLVAGD